MFSLIFRRNSQNVNIQDEDELTPVTPQVQEEQVIMVQPSGSKRKLSGAITVPPPKTQRFELTEGSKSTQAWDLPSGMVSYLHKYISVHISDKEIKDKILDDNPIPSNVKETQALDTYIKELLIEYYTKLMREAKL